MPDPQDSYPRSLLPAAPLASSREDVDPVQLGALVAQLVHGGTAKKSVTPPQQTSQPPLTPTSATGLSTTPRYPRQLLPSAPPPAQPLDLPNPEVNQTLWERLSRDPVGAGIEAIRGALVGAGVPGTPGADTQAARAGELAMAALPLVGGAKSLVTGRGLYSRVEDLAAALPERGLHPNKVASLLKSGAAQEEVAYRKLPEFLASKGNNPVTRAEMQAHLQANPAPFPTTTVLGEPRSPEVQRQLDEITRLRDYGGRISHREWGRRRDAILAQNPEQLTKYQSYSLPGGDAYREHLLQLPDYDPRLAAREQVFADHANQIQAIDNQLDAHVNSGYSTLSREQMQTLLDQRTALEQSRDAAAAHFKQLGPIDEQTTYREGHYGGDYPNVLAHVRTTERNLPPPPMRSLPEIESIIQDVVGAKFPEHIASGGPQAAVRQGLITPDEAQAYSAHRGFYNGPGNVVSAPPVGPRGRFLEEVQSDWHQQGKRSGYQTPPSPEQQQRLAQLPGEITAAQQALDAAAKHIEVTEPAYLNRMRDLTRTGLPPEWQHLSSFADALRQTPPEPAVAAWRAARDPLRTAPELESLRQANMAAGDVQDQAIARLNALREEQTKLTKTTGVPDAPFKDTWPDLALKQQLLDVARDPHANWLGFTGGKTQAARYDLSKQVSQLSFEPHSPGDYSMGDLVALDHQGDEVIRQRVPPAELDDHIGKEPANALRQKIAEHQRSAEYDRSQWSVGHDTDNHNYFHIYDPNGEPLHTYDGALEHFRSEDAANARIDELLARDQETNQQHPFISGLDLQVGGEGMTHFYDNLLPARLRKLVKPFGGTVEPFDLPASKEGFRILNQHGEAVGRYDNLRNAQADLPNLQRTMPNYQLSIAPPAGEPSWITRLTPEMKREILRRGFPLLTLPLAAGAASLASRPGADVGQPPPVQPPR